MATLSSFDVTSFRRPPIQARNAGRVPPDAACDPERSVLSPEPPVKRQRADKREITRARVIDATYTCLVKYGYAGTTTALIASTAGVSQGSVFGHFGAKDDLMIACVEESFARFMAESSVQILALATEEKPSMSHIVEVLWERFQGPTMQAMRELMMASRTHDGLAAALLLIDESARESSLQLAALILPDLADHPRFSAFVLLTTITLNGAAFSADAYHDPDRDQGTLEALAQALELLLEEARRPAAHD